MSNNYVQKATGASPSGLTDSLIFDGGSSIGINTSSPQGMLDILNNTSSYPGPRVTLSSNDTSANSYSGYQFYSGSTFKGGFFRLKSNDDLNFWTAGSLSAPRLTIESSTGNVGIATASPATLLDVRGDVYIGDGSKGLLFDNDSAAGEDFQRIITVRAGMATTPRPLVVYSGLDSNGEYQDTFFARVDYASSNLRNKCPAMKFGGTTNKLETFSHAIAEYNNPGNLILRRAGTTPGGGGDNVFADEGVASGVTTGQPIGKIRFQSLDDNNEYSTENEGNSAMIVGRATEDATPDARGGQLEFYTTPNGSDGDQLRLVIYQDGLIEIPSVTDESRSLKFKDDDGSSIIEHQSGGGIRFSTASSDISPGTSVRLRIAPTNLSAGPLYIDNDGKTLTSSNPSSRLYKEDIVDFTPDTRFLFDLPLKAFRWKTTGESDCGVLAEDVKTYLPDLFRDGGGTIGWRADQFPLYLFQALKELKRRVDVLESDPSVRENAAPK